MPNCPSTSRMNSANETDNSSLHHVEYNSSVRSSENSRRTEERDERRSSGSHVVEA